MISVIVSSGDYAFSIGLLSLRNSKNDVNFRLGLFGSLYHFFLGFLNLTYETPDT